MSDPGKFDYLLAEIQRRHKLVQEYLNQTEYAGLFRPEHIHDAAYSYIRKGGKSLRPTVLLLSCGAVGGDEQSALPAAAAVEVYHTWTLVHDDIIDKDDKRRGAPTLHEEFTLRAQTDLGWTGQDARHYGLSLALLAGDMQQAWAWALLFELYTKYHVDPGLVIQLAFELATHVQALLVEGETLDVQYSKNFDAELNESMVISMLWRKTGVLYEFAGRAGAAIGLGDTNPDIPVVKAIKNFCGSAGTAFQIQDDILGIVGDESQLGKPVGSDIREGKRTLITLKALEIADEPARQILQKTLGNPHASLDDIQVVTDLLRELGAIEYTQTLARQYIEQALESLALVHDSPYKKLLEQWAEYLIERKF